MIRNTIAFNQPIIASNACNVNTCDNMFRGAVKFNTYLRAWNVNTSYTCYNMSLDVKSTNVNHMPAKILPTTVETAYIDLISNCPNENYTDK